MSPHSQYGNECPCENCVCQAICKPKNFIDLVLGCKLIDDFTSNKDPESEESRHRVVEVYKSLKPSGWRPLES